MIVVLVITMLRLIIPMTIFGWPLLGIAGSITVDAFDWDIIKIFNLNFYTFYQYWDKALDLYYLTFFFILSLKWKNNIARKISIVLFTYRVGGEMLFYIFKNRSMLFVFPNLFEMFFLFYLISLWYFKKDIVKSFRQSFLALFVLLIPKLAQEYILHVAKWEFWRIIFK